VSDTEFGGIGFAPGVVRGTRAFDVDALGRLTGVTYKEVWVPGENQAKCLKEQSGRGFKSLVLNSVYGRGFGGYIFPSSIHSDAFAIDIDVPKATFTGNSFVVNLGDKTKQSMAEAFLGIKDPVIDRAMKETLRKKEEAAAEEERKKKEREASDNLADCAHGFYGYYEGSNDYKHKGRINAVIEGYGEVVIGTRGFRAMKARIIALHFPKKFDLKVANMVARNYPDVPMFGSFDDMVTTFPPDDAGMAPTPATDPEFWTRKV